MEHSRDPLSVTQVVSRYRSNDCQSKSFVFYANPLISISISDTYGRTIQLDNDCFSVKFTYTIFLFHSKSNVGFSPCDSCYVYGKELETILFIPCQKSQMKNLHKLNGIWYLSLQIDFKLPVQLWRKNRRDFVAWLACLIVCLCTDVEIGLLCGIVLNILHLLFMWARPETVVKIDELDNMQYIRIVPNVGMFFPGIDHLRETVNKAASAAEYKVPAVIDCTKFNGLDYTSAQVIIILSMPYHKPQAYI